MTDPNNLVQEKFVDRPEEARDPEYNRLIGAYVDDPLFDLKKIPVKPETEEKKEDETHI